VIVADIGGGSTEIILAHDRTVRFSRSFPIGSGRLTEQFVRRDPPAHDELDACRAFAEAAFAEVPFDAARRPRLLITGGTGEYSFRMIPDGQPATAQVIDSLLNDVTTVPSAELALQLEIAEARAKVLPAGIAVMRAVIELAKPVEIQAAQSGIRRGLLLAAFAGTI
jgi:exopolyphosphatase/pppGpp-phosphohydrolase